MAEKFKAMLPDLILGMVMTVLTVVLNRNQGFHIIHLLCDGFFVGAMILLCTGGIRFCQSKGALDGLSYGASSLLNTFLHAGQLNYREEDYFTYCQRKAEERKPFRNSLIAGLIYLALAFVCLALYMVIPGIG